MWIATVSVALTVAVLELTLAVVGGFRDGIVHKVRGLEPDISITPAYDYTTGESEGFITLDRKLDNEIRAALPEQAYSSLCLRYPAVIKTKDNYCALVFKAYGQNHDFGFEQSLVVDGTWPNYESGQDAGDIVLSSETVRALGLNAGDKVDCYFFVNGNIKARKPKITAVYESNFGENDDLIAYASLPWLQKIAAVDSLTGTNVEIRNINDYNISAVAEKLQTTLIEAAQFSRLDKIYPVDNLMHTASVYFNWLDLLDTNVIVIFILMACVAGFTLISSLFILILERIRTIGLLRAIGMSIGKVRNVFIYMALRYVLVGLVTGNILGIGIIFAQKILQFIPLNPQMYYLSYVPVKFDIADVLWLNIGVIVVAWLVMILPAQLVSTVRPSQTIQYE